MKKVTLLGFICLAVMLTVMSFAACAPQTAAPSTATVTVTAPPVTVTSPPVQQMFTVLDPRGIDPDRQIFPLSPRLPTLEGKTVNVINLHGGNEKAIESIAPALQKAVPACKVVYFRTDGGFGGLPLTTDDWAKMTKCDAAILGHDF